MFIWLNCFQRVDTDVDQQQHLFGHTGTEQGGFVDRGQRQRYDLLQAAEQVDSSY